MLTTLQYSRNARGLASMTLLLALALPLASNGMAQTLKNAPENTPRIDSDSAKKSDASPSAPPAAGPALRPTQPGLTPDWRRTQLKPDAAYGAYQRGHFVTAFKEAMKRVDANGDDAAAMTLIAELFKDGLGVRVDLAEAVRWYKLAESRGDRQAAFALGRAYLRGRGTAKDIGKARVYFEKAAAKGHGAALYNLGIMEIGGDTRSNTNDFRKAVGYFRQAAEYGSLDGLYSLAVLYRKGAGVPKDDIKASQLLQRGADRHHLAAMTEYAIVLFNGNGVKKDEQDAARYFTRAAWRNSPIAQNRLARLYVTGRGVKKDMIQAMKWHIIAKATGIQDKWLDAQLPKLTRTQRKIVNEQVRKFARK